MKKFFTLLLSLAVSAGTYVRAQHLTPVSGSSHHGQSVSSLMQKPVNGLRQTETEKFLYGKLKDGINGVERTPAVRVEIIDKKPMRAKAATATDVIEVNASEYANDWEYYPSTKDWYCSVNNGDYILKIDVYSDNAESPVGEYSSDKFNYSYAWGKDNNVEESQSLIQYMTATATVTEAGYKTYNLDATINATDGRVFHLVCSPKAPVQPTETINVDASVSAFTMDPNGSTLTLTGAGKTIKLVYGGLFGLYKSFAPESEVSDGNGKSSDIDNGELRVTLDANNIINIEGEVVTADAVCYKFKAKKNFEVKSTNNYECHNMIISDLWGQLFYLRGTDQDDNMITGTMYLPVTEGNFTDEMTFYINKPDNTEIQSYYVKNAVVSRDEKGNYVLDASFIDSDYNDYIIKMDAVLPEVTETRDFVATNGKLTDITEKGGVVQIYSDSQDKKDWFSVILEMNSLKSGHFSELTNLYRSSCQILTDQDDESATEVHSIDAIDLDFTYNADETYSLTGTCQTGEIKWNVNITGKLSGTTGSDYDMQEDVAYSFKSDDIVTFKRQNSGTDNFYLVNVTDGSMAFSTQLFVDGDDLPAGDYTFSSDRTAGTALACKVDATQGTIAPTFFGSINSEGYITVPLFMCMNGTISVSYDSANKPSLLVKATNTWGNTATIGINHTVDGIRSATAASEAKSGKFIENRRMVILRNGSKFNALGQKID